MKRNKGFLNMLRALILAGSLLGFTGGWVIFAHSGKPAPDTTPAVQAPSFPQAGSPRRSRGQQLPSQSPFGGSSGFVPRLRTGAS